MKSQRSSFLRSAQVSHRRAFGNGGRTLIESRRFARAQFADTRIDQSLGNEARIQWGAIVRRLARSYPLMR